MTPREDLDSTRLAQAKPNSSYAELRQEPWDQKEYPILLPTTEELSDSQIQQSKLMIPLELTLETEKSLILTNSKSDAMS